MTTKEHLGLTIDLSRDKLLTDFARKLLKDYYLIPGETSPQEGFARAAVAFSAGDHALAQRLYDYASKLWFMFASPVLSNAPLPGHKPKALPISCFLTYVPDTLEGLIDHTAELRWLSVKGGGVGGHWSDVRSISDVAPGPIPFIKTIDADMTAYRQGRTRKGSYAAYLDVSHPDVIEFMQIRLPTGGDPNRKAFNIHNAINISDSFMEAVDRGIPWDLIDPNDGTVRDTVDARELWQRILEIRFRTGEPYLNFIDTANRYLPEPLKRKGLKIHGSNLCNEIHLPTGEGRTAVCCLSSVNLENYDEWKDSQMIADLVTMLDNVLQFFIDHASSDLANAIYSAKRERSLGLGAMGFHSYLQRKGVPFESAIADSMNRRIFKSIKSQAVDQSHRLAVERGEYLDGEGETHLAFADFTSATIKNNKEIMVKRGDDERRRLAIGIKIGDIVQGREVVEIDRTGCGLRNSHLMAIAPNANNSIIAGCSPSIEPIKSNAYTHRTRAGSHLVKNKFLGDVLAEHYPAQDKWAAQAWASILERNGHVESLSYLDNEAREAFEPDFDAVVEDIRQREKVLKPVLENYLLEIKELLEADFDEVSIEDIQNFFVQEDAPIKSSLSALMAQVDEAGGLKAVEDKVRQQRRADAKQVELSELQQVVKKAKKDPFDVNTLWQAILDNGGLKGFSDMPSWIVSQFKVSDEGRLAFVKKHKKDLIQYVEANYPDKEQWLEDQWQSIILNSGSVQHLPYLDDYTKDTFKTSFELDQRWVVEHAGNRQPEICQGQSVNLFFPYGTPKSVVNAVHLKAHKAGLKGLYYLRTEAGHTGDKVSQRMDRQALGAAKGSAIADSNECLSCEG